MRHLHFILLTVAAAISLLSCNSGTGSHIFRKMDRTVRKGQFLFGHEDDRMSGRNWNATRSFDTGMNGSDIKEVCGNYPFILGFDLGGIEWGSQENIEHNDFDLMRFAAQKHSRSGGLVTAGWKLRNPVTYGYATDTAGDPAGAILSSGPKSLTYSYWLECLAEYLKTFEIPVLIRPFQDFNTDKYWWGKNFCTADQFKEIWRFTWDFLTKNCGNTELIWVISPSSGEDFESWMERYPGDEYVDIFALDHYQTDSTGTDEFITEGRRCLEILEDQAARHKKRLAIAETGCTDLQNNPDWWTSALMPLTEGFGISYVLCWSNPSKASLPCMGPYPGSPDEEDFLRFAGKGKAVLLEF